MAEIDNPPPDLDYEGDAMDMYIPATHDVVALRRVGAVIRFGVSNAVTRLDAGQAEFIARHLFAASVVARLAGEG